MHNLPKCTPTTQRIQVGNGQCVGILFIIAVIVDIHGCIFEMFTLVSEFHENVDLVLGIKNVSGPIYLEKEVILKPDEQKLVKVKAPFVDEISGLAIIKIID